MLYRHILDAMGIEPTDQQRALIDALARFCAPTAQPFSVFLLNGYAGTGKTTVVGALVKALTALRRQVVLLAPTGRAAKVLSAFAGRPASTIHRKIYKGDGLDYNLSTAVAGVADNPHKRAVFIVDEASMIGSSDNEHASLLDDLIQYVYTGDRCTMILLGDTAQLPPIGCAISPAMDVDKLKSYGLHVSRAVLTRTVRQLSGSGILYNATRLRRDMRLDPLPVPKIVVDRFDDVKTIGGEELEDDLAASYYNHGIDNTILITRSNKRAMQYNLAIRRQIIEKEEDLSPGERVIIAKNNYFWTQKIKGADFIANGDMAIVNRIYGTEIRGFLRFADVELTLPDRDITLDAKLILNSLTAETAGLNPEHEEMLIQQTFAGIDGNLFADPATRRRITHTDPYYNALRVKYAYAVTCHKAQGGQWDSVFIDMAMIAPEAFTTPNFYRWLYTATTRASRHLTYVAPTLPFQ